MKLFKRSSNSKSRIRILAGVICIALVAGIAWTLFNPSESDAAWYDDNYAFRTGYSFTHNAALSDRRLDITINTSTLISAGKMQSDCDDSRFTDNNGKKLRYQLVSGCNTSSTSYSIVFPTVLNGLNNYFFYYGNPAATSLTDSTVSSVTSVTPSGGAPSAASEEKAPGPIAYWKFDEGQGTTAQDSTTSNFDATLANIASPATATSGWQPEDMCISGKCLAFDGSNDTVTTSADSQFNGASAVSFGSWINLNNVTMSDIGGIINHHSSTFQNGFGMEVNTSLVLACNVLTSAGASTASYSLTSSQRNTWLHVFLFVEFR